MDTVNFEFMDINWVCELEVNGDDIYIFTVLQALHTGSCGTACQISGSLQNHLFDHFDDKLNELANIAYWES